MVVLAFLYSFVLTFDWGITFGQISQWSHDGGVVLNTTAVEPTKTQKGPQGLQIMRHLPVRHGFHLLRISSYPVSRYNMSHIFDLWLSKLALVYRDFEPIFFQPIQHFQQHFLMLF